MDGIEGSRAETTAKDKSAVFAGVLCQVDGFGGRSQAFPPSLPELESGFWANQQLIDSDEQLRKVADRLAVIFNSNFEGTLNFCCPSAPAPRDRKRKSGAGFGCGTWSLPVGRIEKSYIPENFFFLPLVGVVINSTYAALVD